MKKVLTAAMAHKLWRYDEETGYLFWRHSGPRRRMDHPVGSVTKAGYRVIKGRPAHHIVWLMHYGKLPRECLDHINGARDDNRIENLREVSHSQNSWNQGAHHDNPTGLKGVTWSKSRGKWRARICVRYKRHFLGWFDTKEAAHAAYCDAAARLHGEFANFG
jgi:hypothetical protein